MAASTVTERTSVVLVSSIGTKIYLSSVGYPGHIVTIKDYTGVASQGNPIVVSTTNNVFFADGSISTLLMSPFSFLTVSSKTPLQWQILNNVGFLTTLSNSFVKTLTAGNAYLKIASTMTDVVSTSIVQNVNITNSLTILGEVDILGDITVNGYVDLFSTLNVKESISFSTGLTVNGPVAIASTLFVRDAVSVEGDVFAGGDIIVGENLYVSSVFRVAQTLVPKELSVQTLSMNLLNVFGSLQTSESISTGRLFVGDSLTTLSSFLTSNNLIIQGNTRIVGDAQIQETLVTSVLEVQSSGVVQQEGSVSSLQVYGTLSTAENLFVRGFLNATTETHVSSVLVSGSVSTGSLVVGGNAEISSIVTIVAEALGNLSLFENLTTGFLSAANTEVKGSIYMLDVTAGGITSTLSNIAVLGDVFIGCNVLIKENAFFETLSSLSSLVIYGNLSTNALFVGNNLIVEGDFEIPGTARLGALAAPNNIVLSTLTLSNSLTVETTASIPILMTGNPNPIPLSVFPETMRIGPGTPGFTGFLETPSMNVRGRFEDLSTYSNAKNIVETHVSTIQNADFLKLFLVGTSNFEQPRAGGPGRFLVGSNQAYTIDLDTTDPFFSQNSLAFSTITYGAAYGKGIWVGVGQDGQEVSTIKYSSDLALNWNQVKSGGFPVQTTGIPPFEQTVAIGKDIVYVSTSFLNGNNQGIWIAGGFAGTSASDPMTNQALQHSINGSDWIPYFQGFCNLFEVNRLFVHSFTLPLYGTIVLAGGNRGLGEFGLSYSSNLSDWVASIPLSYINGFVCQDICEDDQKNIYAVGQDALMQNAIVGTNDLGFDSNWISKIGPYSSNLPLLDEFKTMAFGNGLFVLGGTPQGGNPANSLWITWDTTMSNWSPATLQPNAGFSGTVNRVIYDSNNEMFVAVGENGSGYNLQYSLNGTTWMVVPRTFPNTLYAITPSNATILRPDDTSQYFIANVETRFVSGISTVSLNVSTVKASSIAANSILGDASFITNINHFGSSIFTSSILTQELLLKYRLNPQEGFSVFETSTVTSTATFTYANSYPTFSTLSIYNVYGAGEDSVNKGTVQLTSNNSSWSRASNPVFDGYGNAIYGNSNFLIDPGSNTSNSAAGIVEPVYVATGADTRTNYTIQYSQNGFDWFPVLQGGFSNLNSDGFKVGTTIAYRNFPYRFLVGGEATGTMSTIFYSDQGFSFTPVNPSPALMNSVKKLKWVLGGGQNVLGLNHSNYVIYSTDGINWQQTNTNVQFNAIACQWDAGYWFGITSNGGIYISLDQGSNFSYNGQAVLNFTLAPLLNILDFEYGGPKGWVATVSNSPIAYIGASLTLWDSVAVFYGATQLKSLTFDRSQNRFFIGAESINPQATVFIGGANTCNWTPITTGGFSSFIEAIGTGFAVVASTNTVLAGGIGAFAAGQPPKPQILHVNDIQFPPTAEGVSTTVSFTQSNSSNIFKTSVRALGIASTMSQLYPYVALGDADIPQKSIARSSNLTEWIPAITGGFSTGYGVMYYNNLDETSVWLGVGAATASTANIQYSPDGANWFATNNSGGIPSGGRGLALLSTATLLRVVAVGEAPYLSNASEPRNTIVYSDDGFNWVRAGNDQGFLRAGYCIAGGYKSGGTFAPVGECVIAGGPIQDNAQGLKTSQDGITWADINTLTFSKAVNGIAYGFDYYGQSKWVIVGENTDGGGTTIYYSSDGENWSVANYNFFTVGYGVTFEPSIPCFIAVGKSQSPDLTIGYSYDGANWATLSAGGFSNAQALGSANGLYSQSNALLDQNPFIQMSNFIAYSREIPRSYTIPTLRTFSTTIVLNEAMYINISSVSINSNDVLRDSALSVYGDIQASTLVYKGTQPTGDSLISSLIVSSLEVETSAFAGILQTPSWGFGAGTSGLSNVIGIQDDGLGILYTTINETLYAPVSTELFVRAAVGINTITPGEFVPNAQQVFDVNGMVVCSTLTTPVLRFRGGLIINNLNSTYIASSNLTLTTQQPLVTSNTIYSEVSSLQFNNIMTIQQSTQRVGCYTTNPQFDFDVRANGFFSSLTTQKVTTDMVFFTLQSL